MSLENEVCVNEQPYEKCKKYGPQILSDAEILAVFLRTGLKGRSCLSIARNLLGENSDGKALLRLVKKNIKELTGYEGIGEVKAIQLFCIMELSRRLWKMNLGMPKVFNEPATIAAYYMEDMRHLSTEQVRVMYLNTKSVLIKEINLSIGTVNSSLISPREIFIDALKYEAVNIVLVHNHPSGDPTPSREDMNITNIVKKAGDFIGVRLIDHIIIGDNRYISFSEEGLL